MKIARLNPLTGDTVEREIPVKPEDLERWENGEGLIHDIMPYVSPEDREFLMTGITPEQWQDIFNGDEEDEESDANG